MSSMPREEKLRAYREALFMLLREVLGGGIPAFGVCGSLDNVLRVHQEVQLDGYVFCYVNAQAWEHAVRDVTLAANGKFMASSYFIPEATRARASRWEGAGLVNRLQFIYWLIERIDRGEAFVDEVEAEAAGWARADSGKVHDKC